MQVKQCLFYCDLMSYFKWFPHQEGTPRPLPPQPPGGRHAVGQQQQLSGDHQRRAVGLQRHSSNLMGLHQGRHRLA